MEKPKKEKRESHSERKGGGVLEQLACFKRDLETERSLKVHAIVQASNPLEKELLERELVLIDAQISWLEEAMNQQIA